MDAFVWTRRFETGIASVDAQHRQLVDIVNRLGERLVDAAGTSEAELHKTFKQLADYARFHFADEERVMREAGLDPACIEVHAGHHRDFVSQVVAMWQARSSMSKPAEALHGFLSAWLTFHILGEDHGIVRQIRRISEHLTPDQAYLLERTTEDTPTAALLAALQNIYGVLALQNRDLATANRELEDKVEARTRELLQAEKMVSLGQLAAGVAHEINNPIGFVNANLGSLERYVKELLVLADLGAATPAGKVQAEAINYDFLRQDLGALLTESRDGLERVRKIVSDLKEFAHVDEAAWQDADLLAGLESTLNVIVHELRDKVEVQRALQPLPLVRCMPAQINQVFMSLLLNAAQAISGRGIITLKSGVDGERVWIDIADSGCGMDAATVKRIFEPFFTTKPVGKGTGLGLSVTWDIVQKHGGTIEVSSQPRQGTTFRVWLPVKGP